MTELTTYDSNEPDLTDDEVSLLRRAGASEYLIRMCRFDSREIGIERHSVLEETKKYLRGTTYHGPILTEESVDDFNQHGGHFFTKIWEGDLWGAYTRADGNNTPIMKEVFGIVQINQARPPRANPITE